VLPFVAVAAQALYVAARPPAGFSTTGTRGTLGAIQVRRLNILSVALALDRKATVCDGV